MASRLKRLADLAGRELRWVKDRENGGYALRDGDDTVATLRFPSVWSSMATAESTEGSWTFKQAGFLQNRTIIRAGDSDEELAAFRNSAWGTGGTLELAGGGRLEAAINVWKSKFDISTEDGESLVRFSISGVISQSARVEIMPACAALSDAPWLVMLGWYLSIQMRKHAAA